MIDNHHLPKSGYEHMVAHDLDNSMLHEHDPVEIVENKKSRKQKAVPVERIGHPGIQVIIIRRGRIIGHHGRTRMVIVMVDDRRIGILWIVLGRLILHVTRLRSGSHGQTES
jgi:hypothetical protein